MAGGGPDRTRRRPAPSPLCRSDPRPGPESRRSCRQRSRGRHRRIAPPRDPRPALGGRPAPRGIDPDRPPAVQGLPFEATDLGCSGRCRRSRNRSRLSRRKGQPLRGAPSKRSRTPTFATSGLAPRRGRANGTSPMAGSSSRRACAGSAGTRGRARHFEPVGCLRSAPDRMRSMRPPPIGLSRGPAYPAEGRA
jgi:hypothetical protein